MKINQSQYATFRRVHELVNHVVTFLTTSLDEIKKLVNESAEDVMRTTHEMGVSSKAQREQAEELMLKAHLDPDEEMSKAIDEHQNQVDKIVSMAQDGAIEDDSQEAQAAVDRLRREGGKFSKNVEAISMFEQQITRILLDLVGSLSLEDVLKQLLENVVVLQKEMRQLSDGFPVIMKEGQSMGDVQARVTGLLDLAQKRCKSTAERKAYGQAFDGIQLNFSGGPNLDAMNDLILYLDFVRRFQVFMCEQLVMLSEGYSEIIDKAMNSVSEMSQTSSEFKKHADSMMVKGANDQFSNQSMSDHEKNESELFSEAEQSEKRGLTKFNVPKEMLANLDDEMGNHLVMMMGSLSVGDVVAQRVENLSTISQGMLKIIVHVLEDPQNRLDPEKLNKISADYLAFMKKTFVSSEERKTFDIIFADLETLVKAS